MYHHHEVTGPQQQQTTVGQGTIQSSAATATAAAAAAVAATFASPAASPVGGGRGGGSNSEREGSPLSLGGTAGGAYGYSSSIGMGGGGGLQASSPSSNNNTSGSGGGPSSSSGPPGDADKEEIDQLLRELELSVDSPHAPAVLRDVLDAIEARAVSNFDVTARDLFLEKRVRDILAELSRSGCEETSLVLAVHFVEGLLPIPYTRPQFKFTRLCRSLAIVMQSGLRRPCREGQRVYKEMLRLDLLIQQQQGEAPLKAFVPKELKDGCEQALMQLHGRHQQFRAPYQSQYVSVMLLAAATVEVNPRYMPAPLRAQVIQLATTLAGSADAPLRLTAFSCLCATFKSTSGMRHNEVVLENRRVCDESLRALNTSHHNESSIVSTLMALRALLSNRGLQCIDKQVAPQLCVLVTEQQRISKSPLVRPAVCDLVPIIAPIDISSAPRRTTYCAIIMEPVKNVRDERTKSDEINNVAAFIESVGYAVLDPTNKTNLDSILHRYISRPETQEACWRLIAAICVFFARRGSSVSPVGSPAVLVASPSSADQSVSGGGGGVGSPTANSNSLSVHASDAVIDVGFSAVAAQSPHGGGSTAFPQPAHHHHRHNVNNGSGKDNNTALTSGNGNDKPKSPPRVYSSRENSDCHIAVGSGGGGKGQSHSGGGGGGATASTRSSPLGSPPAQTAVSGGGGGSAPHVMASLEDVVRRCIPHVVHAALSAHLVSYLALVHETVPGVAADVQAALDHLVDLTLQDPQQSQQYQQQRRQPPLPSPPTGRSPHLTGVAGPSSCGSGDYTHGALGSPLRSRGGNSTSSSAAAAAAAARLTSHYSTANPADLYAFPSSSAAAAAAIGMPSTPRGIGSPSTFSPVQYVLFAGPPIASDLTVALGAFSRRPVTSAQQLEEIKTIIVPFQRDEDPKVRMQSSETIISSLNEWIHYAKEHKTSAYSTRVTEILESYVKNVLVELDPTCRLGEITLLANAANLRSFLSEQRILAALLSFLNGPSHVRERTVELLVAITQDPKPSASVLAVQQSLYVTIEACVVVLEYTTEVRILLRSMADLQTFTRLCIRPLTNHLGRIFYAMRKKIGSCDSVPDVVLLSVLKTLETLLIALLKEEKTALAYQDDVTELQPLVADILKQSTSPALSHAAINVLVNINHLCPAPTPHWQSRQHELIPALTHVYTSSTCTREELGYILTLFGQVGAVDPTVQPRSEMNKKRAEDPAIQDEADLDLTYDYTVIVYRTLSRMLDVTLPDAVCSQALRAMMQFIRYTQDKKAVVGGVHAVKAVVQIAKRSSDSPALRIEALHVLAAITEMRHERIVKLVLPEIVVLLEQLWQPTEQALFRGVLDVVNALRPGKLSGKEQSECWAWLYPRLVDVALQDRTEAREFCLRVLSIVLHASYMPPHCIPAVFPMLIQFAQQSDQLAEVRSLSVCAAIHVVCELKAVQYFPSLLHSIRTLTRHCELNVTLGGRLSSPRVREALKVLATLHPSGRQMIKQLRNHLVDASSATASQYSSAASTNNINSGGVAMAMSSYGGAAGQHRRHHSSAAMSGRGGGGAMAAAAAGGAASDGSSYNSAVASGRLLGAQRGGSVAGGAASASSKQLNGGGSGGGGLSGEDEDALGTAAVAHAASAGQEISLFMKHIEWGMRIKDNSLREWFAELQKCIILVSPHPAFRMMIDLFDKHEPLRRELFHPSFKSLYEALTAEQIKKTNEVLTMVLNCNDTELSSKCLGLVDYFDHNPPSIAPEVITELRALDSAHHRTMYASENESLIRSSHSVTSLLNSAAAAVRGGGGGSGYTSVTGIGNATEMDIASLARRSIAAGRPGASTSTTAVPVTAGHATASAPAAAASSSAATAAGKGNDDDGSSGDSGDGVDECTFDFGSPLQSFTEGNSPIGASGGGGGGGLGGERQRRSRMDETSMTLRSSANVVEGGGDDDSNYTSAFQSVTRSIAPQQQHPQQHQKGAAAAVDGEGAIITPAKSLAQRKQAAAEAAAAAKRTPEAHIPTTPSILFSPENVVRAAERTRMYDKAFSYLENRLFVALSAYRYSKMPREVIQRVVWPLAWLYSQRDMQDSVVGLFHAIRYKGEHKDGFAFELLRWWGEAERVYAQIVGNDVLGPAVTPAVLEGYVRTLCFNGEWSKALDAARQVCYRPNAATPPSSTIAQCGATAAWVLHRWDDVSRLADCISLAERNNAATRLFFVNGAHLRNAIAEGSMAAYDSLRQSLTQSKLVVDESLRTLMPVSYSHAYENLTLLQLFTEMEETIDYCRSSKLRAQIVERWNRRFLSLKPDSLQPSLRSIMLHSLVLNRAELSDMILHFCESMSTDYPQLSQWAMDWLRKGVKKGGSPYSLVDQLNSVSNNTHNIAAASPTMPRTPTDLRHEESPSVVIGFISHMWGQGQRGEAVAAMEKFLDERGAELKVTDATCYGHAQLRLGMWKQDLHSDASWKRGYRDEELGHFHKAIRAVSSSYEAWHSWGLMNYRVQQRDHSLTPDELRSFVEAAHQGFVAAICRCVDSSEALPGVMRLLQLWVIHNGVDMLKETVADSISRIPVDHWVQTIPQLIGHLSNESHDVREVISMILKMLCEVHPQAVIFPLLVVLLPDSTDTFVDAQTQRKRDLVRTIIQHCPKRIVNEAETMAKLLVDVSAIPIEQIRENLSCVATSWNPIAEYEEDRDEVSRRLQATIGIFEANRKHLLYTVGDIGQFVHVVIGDHQRGERDKAASIVTQLVDEITKHISEKLGKEPQKAMEPLLRIRNSCIAVFGEYEIVNSSYYPTIASFSSKLDVIPSKKRPRRIQLNGSDGRLYSYCLKGNEDIRMDERVMQLFGMVNVLLSHTRAASSAYIHRFPVIPISPNVGLLGWVENANTINNTICNYRATISQVRAHQESNVLRAYVESFGQWDRLSIIQRTEVLDYVMSCENCGAVDVSRALWHRANAAEQWLDRRTAFTTSLATMSLVGYIMGLGDRHLGNILFSMSTGKIVHIDFGDSFDVGRLRHVLPETIPFRLTRMLTNAMEVFGVDGVFRAAATRTQVILHKNRDSIMALLSAFVYDPIVQHKGKLRNIMEKSRSPQDVAERIRNKLRGMELAVPMGQMTILNTTPESCRRPDLLFMSKAFDDDATRVQGLAFTPEQQVNYLINEATRTDNFTTLYFGWGPLW